MTSLKTDILFSVGEGYGLPRMIRHWKRTEVIRRERICNSQWSL
jgi:hypothetical protein